VLVSLAAAAVVAIDALYLAIIRSQDNPPSAQPLVTPFIAAYLAVIAASLLASLFARLLVKAALRGAASGGLLVMAVVAAFSIGAAILIPAVLCGVATALTVGRTPTARLVLSAVAGTSVAVAILAAGLWFSWSYISCPPGVESGGTTATQTSYTCSNGVLTVGH
jgi:hypothetical protein